MRSRWRVVAVSLLLLAGCNGVPIPGEDPAAFFTRCMAGFGYRVTEVDIADIPEDCCGFATRAASTPAFDNADHRCEEAVRQRYGMSYR